MNRVENDSYNENGMRFQNNSWNELNDVRTMVDLRTTWLVDIPPGMGVDFMCWLMWTSKKDMNALSVSPNVVVVSIMFWLLVYVSMFPMTLIVNQCTYLCVSWRYEYMCKTTNQMR